ncbi:MAG: hypothetical protein Q7V57_11270 [Actinomycetota bacterium]|nr:hypothetical protein [Actinomycetota bacterium]
MKIRYNGTSAVDIPGHDDVQPGQAVDVDDLVGESLLLAGHAHTDTGEVIAPPDPLWSRAVPGDDPELPLSAEPAPSTTDDPEPAPSTTDDPDLVNVDLVLDDQVVAAVRKPRGPKGPTTNDPAVAGEES